MQKWQLTILLVSLLAIQVLANSNFVKIASAQTNPNVYIGVDIAYGAVAEAKSMIDQVSSYTNLVVLGSTQVTWFPDRVQETFQYAYDRGLSIISLPPSLPDSSSRSMNKTEWYQYAKNTWGNRLLGFYCLDEPGGRTLDGNFSIAWNQYTGYPSNYADAASKFETGVSNFLNYQRDPTQPYKTYTADYAFYWFDYNAGYDTVFAELGWNYSRQINIALCRGAATAANKDWGAIITWTYTHPPYIESGEELYNDMLLAYDNGAKYIIVFNGDGGTQGILQPEHFNAIQRFWNYAKNNQPKTQPPNQRTAYVLPNAYGFGFRWPTDHIWGIWEADQLTSNISLSVGTLLTQYTEKLDIIYNDNPPPNTNQYKQTIYWSTYNPTPTPSPTPLPTPTPSPTLNPTKTNAPPEQNPTTLLIASFILPIALTSTIMFFYIKKRNNNKTTTS